MYLNNYLSKYLFLIILIAIISCSSQKRDAKVIKDYIAAEVNNPPYDTLFILTDATDKKFVLSLYEQAFLERSSKNTRKYLRLYPEEFTNWPLNSNDIQQEKSKQGKNYWYSNELGESLQYIPTDSLKNSHFLLQHMHIQNYILYISRPIYSPSKKMAIFHISSGSFPIGSGPYNRGIMIMEKKKGKWIKVAQLWEEYYD